MLYKVERSNVASAYVDRAGHDRAGQNVDGGGRVWKDVWAVCWVQGLSKMITADVVRGCCWWGAEVQVSESYTYKWR